MTEEWRIKTYYEPRVLVETQSVLAPLYSDVLLCIDGGQATLLRNLLDYAHRRSTFVSEYGTNTYLAPTNEEWDALQATVSNLEGQLMGTLCDSLGPKLDAILAAAECVCAKSGASAAANVVDPSIFNFTTVNNYYEYSSNEPSTSIPAPTDEERCGLAQAIYGLGYQKVTEAFLPGFRLAFDTLIPALAGIIALWLPGVGIPAAIGVYVVAELVQELLEIGYDIAETNLTNWLWNSKQDLVCGLYAALAAGGDTQAAWMTVYNDLVKDNPELSDGDEVIIKWGLGPATQSVARKAQTENTARYQEVVDPGYCAVCPEEPIIGSDWIAYPYAGDNRVVHYDDPSPSSTPSVCITYDIPSGMRLVGVMFQVRDQYGTVYNWDRNPGGGCGGSTHSLCGPLVDDWPPGWWYWHNAGGPEHDRIEARDTLHAGATLTSGLDLCTGPLLAGYQIRHPHAAGRIGGYYWETHYLVYRYP
jgi:hypothetical protein